MVKLILQIQLCLHSILALAKGDIIANPVEYAERTLGVHVPWQQARSLLEAHEHKSRELVQVKSNIRFTKAAIADRTMEVRTEAPAHAEFPVKGVQEREKFVKLLCFVDDTIRAGNDELEELLSEQDSVEASLKHIEVSLNVLTARMNELSGLLDFYAAAKSAERPVVAASGNDINGSRSDKLTSEHTN